MARVVLVHGAFNELWGPNELKARWVPALQDGLWHCGKEIDSAEVDVCFYGDLFRREPGTDLDARLARSRAGVADSLSELGGTEGVAALSRVAGDAAYERTVDMVNMMVTDKDLVGRLRQRIESAVDDGTRVLVAHSLGTLLSYVALCNHPDWSVDTFVTLGSPLSSQLVAEKAGPFLHADFGGWPGVRRWVNIRAVDDVACAAPLAELFGPRVEEFVVDNGHRAHAAEPYLNASATGEAVAQALV